MIYCRLVPAGDYTNSKIQPKEIYWDKKKMRTKEKEVEISADLAYYPPVNL